MPETSLLMRLEALLFVAAEPLSADRLAAATGTTPEAVTLALVKLSARLEAGGIRLSELDGSYRFVTAPEVSTTVRSFLQQENKSELSRAALETLAIVAYRGPLAKNRIDSIRGVASDTMIRNLLGRGLIAEAGRSQEPGRPIQYAISHTFLQHFGFTSPAELPPLTESPE